MGSLPPPPLAPSLFLSSLSLQMPRASARARPGGSGTRRERKGRGRRPRALGPLVFLHFLSTTPSLSRPPPSPRRAPPPPPPPPPPPASPFSLLVITTNLSHINSTSGINSSAGTRESWAEGGKGGREERERERRGKSYQADLPTRIYYVYSLALSL